MPQLAKPSTPHQDHASRSLACEQGVLISWLLEATDEGVAYVAGNMGDLTMRLVLAPSGTSAEDPIITHPHEPILGCCHACRQLPTEIG